MATKLDGILARMHDMGAENVRREFIGMIYGDPGAGKTHLAMGLAQKLRKGGDIILLDSSDGWVSLAGKDMLTKNARRLQVQKPDDLPLIANAIEKRQKGFENVSVVILDEGSSIANDILETVVRQRAGASESDVLPEIEGRDYGPAGQIFVSMISKFHRIEGLHLIIVAHNREKTEDGSIALVNRPMFPPLLLTNLMAKMHVVAFVTARRKADNTYVREVQAQPSATVRAKSRINDMQVKTGFGPFGTTITNWVVSDSFESDLAGEEAQAVVSEDEEETEIPDSDEIEDTDESADELDV